MATKRRRTKGAGSAFRDGRGIWHFRKELSPDPGTGERRIIEATGRVKADARARLDAKVAEYERTGVIRTRKGPTVADYAERWMETHRRDVKPNTWDNERSWMNTMCRHIGGIRLKDLTPGHIQRMTAELSRTRKAATVNCYLSILSAMLDSAELEELIPVTPMRRVVRPKGRRRSREILGPEAPARLVEAAASPSGDGARYADGPEEDAMWSLMFALAFETGMRPGERYGLMPYQLERRRGVPGIHVCQQVQRYTGGAHAVIPDWLDATHLCGRFWLTTPKSERGNRFIPVSETLWNRLWEHVAAWGIGMRQLMFANGFGRPIARDVEIRRWRRALEKARLPEVDIYSARHLLSTMLAESGASPDARMRIMGHADLSTTAGYTHWSPTALAAAMRRADAMLAGA